MAEGLHLVSNLYDERPQELKKVKAMTGDPTCDRYGFIGASHPTFLISDLRFWNSQSIKINIVLPSLQYSHRNTNPQNATC